MTLNTSIRYHDGQLHLDNVTGQDIITKVGTPVYTYSMKRALSNMQRIKTAFSGLDAHLHYSAKANGNIQVLRHLIDAGAGVDAVSGGEIYRALKAGAAPEQIVFAGVGKTLAEINYAVEKNVGWFNVENVDELALINRAAKMTRKNGIQIALRLNPEVTASTHPYIATGHGGAKFGLSEDIVRDILSDQDAYPYLNFAGIHVHIGSQLGDIDATRQAVEKAIALIAPFPDIKTVNIGGGMPAPYHQDDDLPLFQDFADALAPILQGYTVLLEPGRAIIADAGVLFTQILYVKEQANQTMYIVDASMTDIMRPMLYGAKHEIVPLVQTDNETYPVQIVGPVCETTDVLGKDVMLPAMQSGDYLAILTAGAYGMVMASNYNARPRPPEVIVHKNGKSYQVARRRETWRDLILTEDM